MNKAQVNKEIFYEGGIPGNVYNKYIEVREAYIKAKRTMYWGYLDLTLLTAVFLLRDYPAEALDYLDEVLKLKDHPDVIAEDRRKRKEDFSGRIRFRLPKCDISEAACKIAKEIDRDYGKTMNRKITYLQEEISNKSDNPEKENQTCTLRYSRNLSIERLKWFRIYFKFKADRYYKSTYHVLIGRGKEDYYSNPKFLQYYESSKFDSEKKNWHNAQIGFINECVKTRKHNIKSFADMHWRYFLCKVKGYRFIFAEDELGNKTFTTCKTMYKLPFEKLIDIS